MAIQRTGSLPLKPSKRLGRRSDHLYCAFYNINCLEMLYPEPKPPGKHSGNECTNPCILNNYCPLLAARKPIFQTHHCLLHVNFLTTGQAEVCYFCHKVIAYENIPCCQIPVDKLMLRERRIAEEAALCDISTVNRTYISD